MYDSLPSTATRVADGRLSSSLYMRGNLGMGVFWGEKKGKKLLLFLNHDKSLKQKKINKISCAGFKQNTYPVRAIKVVCEVKLKQ